jgi:hypothetical protein
MTPSAARFRPPTDDEQHILVHLQIRLMTPEETARCISEIISA